jgi:hypothetical protein
MPVPVTATLVEETAGLTPSLFNFMSGNPVTDQANLDALIGRMIARADAWMQGHMLGFYGLTSPAWAPVLQEEGQIYLTLEKLSALLKSLKTQGTHFPYVQEDSPAFQTLIETDWGERAMAALDLWVTIEISGNRAFASPVMVLTDPICPWRDLEPMSSQYSSELDFARGISNPDIGTLRR